MVDQQTEHEIEEPLDPAFEKVRRKMVRLLAVSIGTMMIGVLAVLAAVVYRINSSDGSDVVRSFPITLPETASIAQMSVSDTRIAILVTRDDATQELIVYNSVDGSVVSRSAIEGGLPALGVVPE